MNHSAKTPFLQVISLLFTLLFAKAIHALPFGIYDPRSLAMGGAGVAAARSENAMFYNPAILSTYDKYKEDANNEAFSFPVVAVRASKSLETLADQQDRDYETEINTNVSNFNNNQTPENALVAVSSISSLLSILSQVANNVFLLDATAALAVGVPSKHQGGAFFITHRVVGDGQLSIPAADLELLSDYQEELNAVAAGNAPGTLHPELYTGGNLNDPSASIAAEANARAVYIKELGISLSRQFNIAGTPFSFGVSAKMVQVTTYEYNQTISSNTQDREGTRDDDWQPNIDFGVFKKITPRWQLGLVGKNLIERDYPTASGQHVSVKPQWRIGVAHLTPVITYTVDLDLVPNDGVYPGNAAQFILAGIEIKQNALRYRLGYRDAIAHKGPKEDGVFSAGLGLDVEPVYFDLAYSENYQQRAASLMFGFNF